MARVREVEFGDVDAVAALQRGVGWSPATERGWRRLWVENPAHSADGPPPKRGWVLEEGARVVGFLANRLQVYWLDGHPLRAAVASAMVVAPSSRGETMKLVMAYVQQPHVDLLLNTTAAPQTSKIFEFFKFHRIPQPDYDLSYYWVLRPGPFLAAGLRKKGLPGGPSRVVGAALGPLLRLEGAIRRRGPRDGQGPGSLRVLGTGDVGSDFDDLWRRRVAEGRRLLADRTAPTLRWHFAAEGRSPPARLVCAYEGARLDGYVALVRNDSAQIRLARAYVADIFVADDDPATVRRLLVAAARQARADGAAMLEAVGFPEPLRRLLTSFHPFSLRNDAWPFLYRAREAELDRILSEPGLWHACLFDGDGSI